MKSISKKINSHKDNIQITKGNIMKGGQPYKPHTFQARNASREGTINNATHRTRNNDPPPDTRNKAPPGTRNKAPPGSENNASNAPLGISNGYNTRRSHETNNAQNSIKGDLQTTKNVIIDMHDKGELQGFIDKIISQFGLYISIIIMLLMAPSMPIIFYLTILYNVIILTWENFKSLDVDNIEG